MSSLNSSAWTLIGILAPTAAPGIVVDAELVDVAGDRTRSLNIGAHRRRDFGVGQRISPRDHRAFADDLHPVEDRPRVGQINSSVRAVARSCRW